MGLPLIPHCELDPDCCGCLNEIVDEQGSRYVCNECGAVVSKEDVARIVMEMDSTAETCPHCGKLNRIEGFLRIYALSHASIAGGAWGFSDRLWLSLEVKELIRKD